MHSGRDEIALLPSPVHNPAEHAPSATGGQDYAVRSRVIGSGEDEECPICIGLFETAAEPRHLMFIEKGIQAVRGSWGYYGHIGACLDKRRDLAASGLPRPDNEAFPALRHDGKWEDLPG